MVLTSFLRIMYIDLLIFPVRESSKFKESNIIPLLPLLGTNLMSLFNVCISLLFSISKCPLN